MTRFAIACCLVLCRVSAAQDANDDFTLFPEQLPGLWTVPNAVDSNQDGELSMDEVLAAPEALIVLDMDGDGSLDAQEMGAFDQFLPMVRGHNITNLIDADGDVNISAEEVENASEALMILDADGNWHIDTDELTVGLWVGPHFNTGGMTLPVWNLYRGYTTELDGPTLPGEDVRAFEGYMLIHEAGDYNLAQMSNATYLLGPDGAKVHEWPHPGYSPEASVAYLLPNGQLLRTVSTHHWTRDKRFPVGATTSIELVNWDGEAVWTYTMSVPEKYSFHHDVEYLPNGNILAIRYTGFTTEEATAMGWDPDLGRNARHAIDKTGSGLVWLDTVLELEPDLEDGSTEIVWQWNSWEHLVQDRFPDRKNYGDISDPGKIHVNYLNLDTDVPYNSGQFFHVNTVDYHPGLDMIVLSSATYGEIWFIDHSTTTAEAASGEGGRYGQGGDLLYRWGNDEAWGKGTRDDSILYWQHDIQWIGDGLPGAGNMLVFNNGNRRTLDGTYARDASDGGFGKSYTDVLEVRMPMNGDGTFDRSREAEIVWSWEEENRADYYSPFMSGVQRLPNGNTIFNRAFDKYITEVTPQGEKVLHFTPPGWGRLYRIYKFAPDYPGLTFTE